MLYQAPETFLQSNGSKGTSPNYKSDLWSFGLLMMELLIERKPYFWLQERKESWQSDTGQEASRSEDKSKSGREEEQVRDSETAESGGEGQHRVTHIEILYKLQNKMIHPLNSLESQEVEALSQQLPQDYMTIIQGCLKENPGLRPEARQIY